MAGSDNDIMHEVASKIGVERHKVFSEKKLQCVERLKYVAWLTTSLMAVNVFSIATGKVAGAIEMNRTFILIFSVFSIILLAYSLNKILAIMITCSIDRDYVNKLVDGKYKDQYSWKSLACELDRLIFYDLISIQELQKCTDRSMVIVGLTVGATFGAPFIEAICKIFFK